MGMLMRILAASDQSSSASTKSASWNLRALTYRPRIQHIVVDRAQVRRAHQLIVAILTRRNDAQGILNSPLTKLHILELSFTELLDEFGQDLTRNHKAHALLVHDGVDERVEIG
jgi:hypothetical protein